jgi:hypothetical protein
MPTDEMFEGFANDPSAEEAEKRGRTSVPDVRPNRHRPAALARCMWTILA